ncbi:MAG: hypothetical protein HRT88_15815 [Lentisphaeraceae bacterium]|nr:hypothetical protein [Lentisphaeraceae bacterium]
MKKIATFITIALLSFACGKKEETKAPAVPQVKSAASKVFVGAAPQGAISVIEARKLSAGKKVVIKGAVIGSRSPFVEGRASFVLGDPAVLTSCNLKEGDNCDTPWDTCCDTKTSRRNSVVSIQVLDADGMVMKAPVKGVKGLSELSHVVVEGTVDASSTEKSMIINATAIFVEK